MILALVLQTSLCVGRVTDKASHPMQSLPKPVYGQTYTDPPFGTKITRVTDRWDGSDIFKPMYSTMPAWNADETLLLLWSRQHGHVLFYGQPPYWPLAFLNPFHPTDIEQVLWDPADPNVLWYPSNFSFGLEGAIPVLMKQTIKPWETKGYHDFRTPPTNCPVTWSDLLKLGSDPQWMGYSRKIVGLQCGNTKFLYSITEDKVLAVGNEATPNAPIVGPSETRVFLDGHVLDMGLRDLGALQMANPGEHASMGRDAQGHDRWNAVAFDGSPTGTLVSWDLVTKALRVIVGPSTGWPDPKSGTHLSAIATKAPGWVVVGSVGAHTGQTVLDNEIILANVDSGEVCRLAHARTKAGTDCGPNHDQCPWGYWGEIHPVISPSGKQIAFGSDWMGSDSVDTYVIDLRVN